MIHDLSIDLETFSSNDLKKCGVYKYAESKDFEILLFAYSINGEEVKVIDLANGEKIPEEIIDAILDNSITKWAFNASFERICLSSYLVSIGKDIKGKYLNPDSWKCSMIWSATLGLPLSLEGVGALLSLDKQKMSEGKRLIQYFCLPCKPTKANNHRTRNLPIHDKEKWELFKSYNKRDVEVELAIKKKLSRFPVSKEIWDEYHLDQRINDEGVGIDEKLVDSAIELDMLTKDDISIKLKDLTLVDNPNSVAQIKSWLKDQGLEVESLGKEQVKELIKNNEGKINDVLSLRQQLSKSSVKKYSAMKYAVCSDLRVRGMFQFYGANRSGRFSSKIVQLQNLPRNQMLDLKEARTLVKNKEYDAINMLYDDVCKMLSELIRTAFIPQGNNKFIVADFSAIEARVLAWIADEKWRNDMFKKGGDIYCDSASKMFNVPVVKHGINGHLRQKGKIAELACGYGGSVGALKAMGALEMGLKEEELKPLVDAWRSSNPSIVEFWWDVDRCVKQVVKTRLPSQTHGINFTYQSGFLFIELPSKRKLAYVKPKIETNEYGGESITYEGTGTVKKWERIETYGPKLVENIVQGIARDILVYSLKCLKDYRVVAHVHDEAIIECFKDTSVKDICQLMATVPSWARGLILTADGYECDFYMKD